MSDTLDSLYRKQSLIYKYILYFLTVACIVFFFPRGGKFKYEFQKGKPWQYDNLYAPFDFSIQKSEEEITVERDAIESSHLDYYQYDSRVRDDAIESYDAIFDNVFSPGQESEPLRERGKMILKDYFDSGIMSRVDGDITTDMVYLVRDNEASRITSDQLLQVSEINEALRDDLDRLRLNSYYPQFQQLFFSVIRPNVTRDSLLSERALQDELAKISLTRGSIDEGKLIIARGEVVESESLSALNSLKAEFESTVWTDRNYLYILIGYTTLVALVILMLFLFLKHNRPGIYRNNVKVAFIVFNVLLMVVLTTMIVNFNDAYVYIVPLCILPLILKTFFDSRLALFVHMLTVVILGFVVPNSFEFIFLQIVAGIVAVLAVAQLYKRANLFISVGQITFIYMLGYLAFNLIQEGSFDNVQWYTLGFFLLNGMITLFTQPLIYIYETMFGLASDISLLELSDTNSQLLKELGNKAPGTFHHSLQVANLAEAAANQIGADTMLVRVGALYHDIGKMRNPTYFSENQTTNVNPHSQHGPLESARIIIQHVIDGIEIAQKNNLPDRIIDFIRVHHGTTYVYYFYKQMEESGVEFDPTDFQYPGPTPFSRETAIVMMADAVEAASKSLQNPTYTMIDEFVERIVGGQMDGRQFRNANITFKEIEVVKKVLKSKLTNIYHLRVEYPE